LLYEEMNMAQLWKLPVIYACENNMYNEYTHYLESTAGEIAARPAAFGIATEIVDGQDVRAVYAAAVKYVERARRGEGPAFLQLDTYRYHGHHVGDIARDYYRPKSEERVWRSERDPIAIAKAWMLGDGLVDEATLDALEADLAADMDKAVEFATNAPYPDPSEVNQDIYA